MKRVLLIGEHSYIALSFQKYIKKYQKELEVCLVGARNEEWKKVDFSQYDAVVHTAAIVHKKEQPDMRELYQKVNIVFPVELAKKAKKEGVSHFLFFSTMAVYGEQLSPIFQNQSPNPVTLYGKSKLEAEKRLKRLADENFHVTIFRPPIVYGMDCPGNYQRLSKLAKQIPFFPKTKSLHSMIYIENLCDCIWQEINQSVKEEFHIVCPQNAQYINTSDLVRQIRSVNGKHTWLLPFPQKLLQTGCKISGTFQKVFGNCYYEKKEGDREYQVVDFEESIRRSEGIK